MSVHDFLTSIGVKRGAGGLYYSPFNPDENTPSFSVFGDDERAWKCWSTDKHGKGVVSLCEQLYNLKDIPNGTPTGKTKTVFMQVSDIVNGKTQIQFTYSPRPKHKREEKKKKMELRDFRPLKNQKIKDYLISRGIPEILHKKLMEAVVYNPKAGLSFTYLAWKNDNGSISCRNDKNYKFNIGKTGIKTIKGNNALLLFEGFIDFLSYVVIRKAIPKETVIILNSTVNIDKVDFSKFKSIKLYLDNGLSGDIATLKVMEQHNKAYDMRKHYEEYDDVNDLLTNKIKTKIEYRITKHGDAYNVHLAGAFKGVFMTLKEAIKFAKESKK